MASQNFPGVYTQIIDQSFNSGLTSRFTCGMVGIASQGPFNQAVSCPSIGDFVRQFGTGLSGSFLAEAVASIAATSDGSYVVRVGTQYESAADGAKGAAGSFTLLTPNWQRFNPGDYIDVTQVGSASTVNAVVASVGSATVVAGVGTLTLVSAGAQAVPLAANYTGAQVGISEYVDGESVVDSAFQAEAFLDAPSYGTVIGGVTVISGYKSTYSFTVVGSGSISPGDVLKITQTGRVATREIVVTDVDPVTNVVSIETNTNTQTGQQALPLQDNYTSGSVQKMVSPTGGGVALHLVAATAGTWANTVGNAGLTVQVAPGSSPDTKKLIVYQNATVQEVVDNLSMDPTSDNYYATVLAQGNDAYITCLAVLTAEPPSNTLAPWDLADYTASNTASFANGFNGENVGDADYVGTIDEDDNRTGLKVYDDPDNALAAVLAVPGVSSQAVIQELNRIARDINAVAIVDIPDNLNGREAIDWSSAAGPYSDTALVDSYTVAFFWNWFQAVNPFTGAVEFMPPTVGVLGAMAVVFDQYGPWFATAGMVRGLLPQASAVRYPRVSEDVKQAMQAPGNCVNPILLYRGATILIWGDRTTQREDSKLQALHTINLVNYILAQMSNIARRFVFDPNDTVLLQQLTLEFTTLLNAVQTGRGLEQYLLTCDSTNNTAATRNQREVIVDLQIIPTDVAERIFINVTVNQSGAQLNAISGTPPPAAG
jgi:hypothetical protein